MPDETGITKMASLNHEHSHLMISTGRLQDSKLSIYTHVGEDVIEHALTVVLLMMICIHCLLQSEVKNP